MKETNEPKIPTLQKAISEEWGKARSDCDIRAELCLFGSCGSNEPQLTLEL